jgi:NAD(P)-dependent dehydrogenase (short-subunit alcohol dehydrogenase family)
MEPQANPFRLDGEIALITGGGTGIGLGMARCFVESGAKVVLVGRREAPLKEAVAQLGTSASYDVGDVTQSDQAPALVQRINDRVGPISILINNAGTHLKKPAIETTRSEFQSVLDTNVLGAFEFTRTVLPGMIERRNGKILFITSMAALFGVPNVMAYSAAKAAHLGMVRALAVELGSAGVRVNAIAPGWINSDITRRAMSNDPARKAKIISRTPMARFGEADEIGWAAVYLCSAAAKFVTGVVLPIDGGASIGF